MLITDIKHLIYLIESKIKSDPRFDHTLRKKMKFLAYNNNISPNYIPIPIIDTKKINELEKENKEISLIVKNLVDEIQKNKKENLDFLQKYLEKLEKINTSIERIIS